MIEDGSEKAKNSLCFVRKCELVPKTADKGCVSGAGNDYEPASIIDAGPRHCFCAHRAGGNYSGGSRPFYYY